MARELVASFTPPTTEQKAERVSEALRVERDLLRGRKPFGFEHLQVKNTDFPAANAINDFVQNASNESKARLFDILMTVR